MVTLMHGVELVLWGSGSLWSTQSFGGSHASIVFSPNLTGSLWAWALQSAGRNAVGRSCDRHPQAHVAHSLLLTSWGDLVTWAHLTLRETGNGQSWAYRRRGGQTISPTASKGPEEDWTKFFWPKSCIFFLSITAWMPGLNESLFGSTGLLPYCKHFLRGDIAITVFRPAFYLPIFSSRCRWVLRLKRTWLIQRANAFSANLSCGTCR